MSASACCAAWATGWSVPLVAERSTSLRGLLLRRLWLPLLALILAGAVASFALASHFAGEVFDRWLADSAVSLAHSLRQSGGRPQPPKDAVDTLKWDSMDRIYVQILSQDGETLYGDPIPLPAQDGDNAYYDTRYQGHRLRVAEVRQRVSGVDAPLIVRVGETRHKRNTLRARLLLATMPLQAGIVTLAALLLWSGTAAGALAAQQAARRLAAYDEADLEPLSTKLTGPRELQPAFDAMAALIDRVSRAQQGQQRFVSNAAHQLRTPLAALQIQLESALRETDPSRRDEALQHALSGLTRLRHLIAQLLTLNRSSNSSDAALELCSLDLAQLVRAEVERHADRAIEAGVDLGYEGPDAEVQVIGDRQLLRELLTNLVDNALLHGRTHGMVTVTVQAAPPRLTVDDDGPGIPEHEREHVVERFYRIAGHGHGDGSGLGLAIVAEIAARHRAQLLITTSPAGGARIALEFPTTTTGNITKSASTNGQ